MFCALGDEDIRNDVVLKSMPQDKIEYLQNINNTIKQAIMPGDSEIEKYNQIVIDELLPKDRITHNSIIFFTLMLFRNRSTVKTFYQSLYPLIVVDEFQDTNCIAWHLLQNIIGHNTQVLLLGDPLQRIYGFIGAVPNIMDSAKEYLSSNSWRTD